MGAHQGVETQKPLSQNETGFLGFAINECGLIGLPKEGDDSEDQENDEEYLSNPGGRSCDSAKAEDGRE